jgi:hypothetical protein
LEGLALENLGLFYDRLVCLTAIGNILWPFGIFCGHLVIYPHFGIFYQEKSGNPVDNFYWAQLRWSTICVPDELLHLLYICTTTLDRFLINLLGHM